METFSFLKYWSAKTTTTPSRAAAAASSPDSDVDSELDGSFFDLDFSARLPDKQIRLLAISSYSSDIDILFFKPPTSVVTVTPPPPSSEPNSLLKPATKLRVFALGFRKLKSDPDSSGKFFAGARKAKSRGADDGGEGKKPSKEAPAVRKYVGSGMIKPLYVRVSRRCNGVGEIRTTRMGFSGPLTSPTTAKAATAKSRSPPVHQEEEDGIQSAIAHCKRCFSQDLETLEMQPRNGGEGVKE